MAVYPTLSEVQTRINEMGVTAPSNGTITAEIDAVVREWERITGYFPFIAETEDSTNYYEPNSTFLLDFQTGYISVTSITTGVTYGNSSTNLLVVGRDYTLYPVNAIRELKPYTYAKFRALQYKTKEASIQVIGKRGYAEALPADAYSAIMKEILSTLMKPAYIEMTGGMESWKEEDVQETYGAALNNPMVTTSRDFSADFRRAAKRYRRPRIA